MHSLIYTSRARNDLVEIFDFVSHDDLYYGEKVIGILVNFINSLLFFPLIGKLISKSENLREIVEPVFRFRIIYKFEDNNVIIISIFKYKNKF